MTVIAALLTLVGYSMNDTIVIFDRIRENLKFMRRESLETVMNKSRQPDAEPHRHDLRADVSHGDRPVHLGRTGLARVLVRAGVRDYCRYVFFRVRGQSHRSGVAQLRGQA